MTELFGRESYVVIGKRGEVGTKFRGFKTQFDIKMSNKKFPDEATISIYNIQKSAELFLGEKNLIIQLFAGYGEPSVIYTGEIKLAKKKKRRSKKKDNSPKKEAAQVKRSGDTDYITTFQCSSGGESFSNARLKKLWEKEVNLTDVLYDLAETLGVVLELPEDIPKVMAPEGFTTFGPARESFDEVVQMLGFDWFPQLNRFIVVRKGEGKGRKAFKYSSSTGLVGVPEQTNRGVNITVLLNPELFPGEFIELDTPTNKGWYLIENLQHKGDTQGGNAFYTHCQCKSLGRSNTETPAGPNSTRVWNDRGEESDSLKRKVSFDDWENLTGEERGELLQKNALGDIIESVGTVAEPESPHTTTLEKIQRQLDQENLFGI